uniref:Uncharacterized protein n=1 Tax=Oryza glumipatula TaxID=40148 RepID=A0A0D9ZGW4_9ORYZ
MAMPKEAPHTLSLLSRIAASPAPHASAPLSHIAPLRIAPLLSRILRHCPPHRIHAASRFVASVVPGYRSHLPRLFGVGYSIDDWTA